MKNQKMEEKIKIAIKALEQISTGEICGQIKNYKDSLYICKEIATETLIKIR